MSAVRNVLFILCDQLRADHLGCYGHPYMATRNIDALAARGVRFERAFVQSGVCGPSRMSMYTGRYVSSHGATWNRVPLSVGEVTLGEYLNDAGLELSLSGKTHVMPDTAGLARFHLDDRDDGAAALGRLLSKGGFTEIDRHDGHHGERDSAYASYLRGRGYDSPDPWTDYVIAAIGADGGVVSGWNMRNARFPARVAEADSETAYTTDRAIDFIRERSDRPWVLHLSYVKPHWPYIAPAPYHARYTLDQCLPVNRDARELVDPHPVLAAYRRQEECANFMRDEVWQAVRPAYQGLIQQVDDHLGRVWDVLDATGRLDDTLIIFSSDHGDFLGDHWLGEKEHFHDAVQRVPLIVVDPDAAADATRGRAEPRFAEGIDLTPTILDALGIAIARERVEGASLLPITRGANPPKWREFVVSELDYGYREARRTLGRAPDACRAWMVRGDRWKYAHWQDFQPQLFDLESDARELRDLGADPGHEAIRRQMRDHLLSWFMGLKRRVTVTDASVEAGTAAHRRAGVHFGVW
ncbi:MAG: sulfatase-like hydrolase/transferase [Betaproteobacteria bacterium]